MWKVCERTLWFDRRLWWNYVLIEEYDVTRHYDLIEDYDVTGNYDLI